MKKVIVNFLFLLISTTSCVDKNFNLHGVKVKKSTISFWNTIESSYKTKIYLTDTLLPEGVHADSEIDSNCIPFIRVNNMYSKREVDLVHELFHHKMYIEGWPKINYFYEHEGNMKITKEKMYEIGNLIYDPIVHSLFFPEIRKLNLDPVYYLPKNVDELINKPGNYEGIELGFPLFYFKFVLESNDNTGLILIKEWVVKNNHLHLLLDGEKLIEFSKQIDFRNPETITKCYINCLNFLLGDKFIFDIHEMKPTECQIPTRPVVVIRIRNVK